MARTCLAALSVLLVACGGAGPSTPSTSAPAQTLNGFEGQWAGTTSQGAPISLTVSADQKVTTISVGYSLGSCSGAKVFSGLSIKIQPMTTPVGMFDNGFAYGADDGRNVTEVFGGFSSNIAANGLVVFDYSGCGSGFVSWTATRR